MFLLRKLPTTESLQTAYLAIHFSSKKCEIHSTGYLCRKKKLYYNRYIKENKIKVYSGFVQDTLDKTQSDYLQNVSSSDTEPDYEKIILYEAKQRRNTYEHKKALKKNEREYVGVGNSQTKPKRARKFTHEQMDHIKYLRDENPDLWTTGELSRAFNCSKDEINAILRSNFKPRKKTQDAQDFRANNTYCKPMLISENLNESGLSLYKRANALLDSKSSILPPSNKEASNMRNVWFSNYQSSFDQNYSGVELELFHNSDDDFDPNLHDEIHSDEHYQELFEWDVPEDELLSEFMNEDSASPDNHEHMNFDQNEDDNHLPEFKVTTQDNIVFRDDQGKFLYRIP